MAKKLRKIVVNDIVFLWCFSGRWDKKYYSQVTILSMDKNIRVAIKFISQDTFTAGNPLNEGLFMEKNGIGNIINLNQPKYIAEIIDYLQTHFFEGIRKQIYTLDGNQLLFDMGYKDVEHYLID